MSEPGREREIDLLREIRDGVNRMAGSGPSAGAIERAAEIRAAATAGQTEALERMGDRIATSIDGLSQAVRALGFRGPDGGRPPA